MTRPPPLAVALPSCKYSSSSSCCRWQIPLWGGDEEKEQAQEDEGFEEKEEEEEKGGHSPRNCVRGPSCVTGIFSWGLQIHKADFYVPLVSFNDSNLNCRLLH